MMEKNLTVPKLGAGSVPIKLKLLVTIVNREKTDFYLDFLQEYDINLQVTLLAHGTASTETLQLLGLENIDKVIILCVVREDKADEALAGLDRKFKTIRNGKGIAYTIPLTSTIGIAVYRFLSNNLKGADMKWNSHTN